MLKLHNFQNLVSNSKDVYPDDLFICCNNNIEHIQEAISKGAKYVVCSIDYPGTIKIANPRGLLARMASQRYPERPQYITAVTGTNGKSSTVAFIRQFLQIMGQKSASVGSLGYEGMDLKINLPDLTTPDPLSLHVAMQKMSRSGVNYLALEASSHGLSQSRLDGIRFSQAIFTNLSPEHMDYHSNMEDYFHAKRKLFTNLLDGVAIINTDDPFGKRLLNLDYPILTYGTNADFSIGNIRHQNNGMLFDLFYHNDFYSNLRLNLMGEFQVYNVVAALASCVNYGYLLKDLLFHLLSLKAPKGRMQQVLNSNVFVDYAHKADALKNSIQSLKKHCSGKLIVVFGCGGDRDKNKRPMMGEIAQNNADVVIITDDNPRFEDPAEIRSQILAKCPKAIEITPRPDAIAQAINMQGPEDIVLIAGRGHEQYQLLAGQKILCDDLQVARSIIDVKIKS